MPFLSPSIFRPFSQEISAGFFGKPEDFAHPGSEEKIISRLFQENPEIHPHILQPQQVHGRDLFFYDGKDLLPPPHTVIADGVWTNQKTVICTVKTADCIGLLLYHPPSQTVSALHAGHRGLAQKIFTEFFHQSKIAGAECFISLSPSLGPCCSEFSDPIAETPSFFHPFIRGKYVDLWSIARAELLENGVPHEHIEMPAFCTKCDSQKRFWSHRNGEAGRNIGGIMLMGRGEV